MLEKRKRKYRDGEVEQTVGEEIANSITHGIGFLLSVAGLAVGVVFAALHSHAKVVTSVAIYGATMCILYLSSTLYHAIPPSNRAKRVLHVFDHCSIYLLIAGTYTPILLGPLDAAWGLDSSSATAARPPNHFKRFKSNPPVCLILCGQGGKHPNDHSFSG